MLCGIPPSGSITVLIEKRKDRDGHFAPGGSTHNVLPVFGAAAAGAQAVG